MSFWNRRAFLSTLAATAASTALTDHGWAQTSEGSPTLTLDFEARGATVAKDFTGLSYEAAQLANPAFFSTQNKVLIDLFRALSSSGNLRIGGNTSEFTRWSDVDLSGPPPFEAIGPATVHKPNLPTVNTPRALKNLREFLEATNWTLIYGLNAAQGTRENAVAEAAAVAKIMGPRLVCFQLGNEPDVWHSKFRPQSFSYADYAKEWGDLHDAVAAKVSGAKFAGPDVAGNVGYITSFSADAHRYKDIVLLSGHHYVMGPASSPKSTLDRLLSPDPWYSKGLPAIVEAAKQAGIPYRMTEGNSCWDGGKPGVSDTLGAALWCVDLMLHLAEAGAAGVNLHGGGEGFYTPIAGAPSTGLVKRPEYYGIQFAGVAKESTFGKASLSEASPHLTAYGLQKAGQRSLVVVNRSDDSVKLSLPLVIAKQRALRLTGPALDSKETPSYGPVAVSGGATIEVAARSATLYTL